MTGTARPVPTRTCIACRTARPKRDLMRVVRTPDGRLAIDETGRLAGRGAYLCRDGGCQSEAIDKGALSRALETPIPPELRTALQARTAMRNEGGPSGEE